MFSSLLPHLSASFPGLGEDDSLDSGSFDQDSLEEIEDLDLMPQASRDALKRLGVTVGASLKALAACSSALSAPKGASIQPNDESRFAAARDALTSESRQFVTASKLFVKSATESEETLLGCLQTCMTLLTRMVELTQALAQATATPQHTLTVVSRVGDVASAYQGTVRAALGAAGKGMEHPAMNALMAQATSLAGVLTALMRTLRVFSP